MSILSPSLNKQAGIGSLLKMLKGKLPRSPGPLPPGKGVNELLARQATKVRGRPPRKPGPLQRPGPPAGPGATAAEKAMWPMHGGDRKLLLGIPAAGGAAGAALAGGVSAHHRIAARQAATATPPSPPPPAGGDSGVTGGDGGGTAANTPGWLNKYGPWIGGGMAAAGGLYGLRQLLRRKKDEEPRNPFGAIPKAAAADPAQFCVEFPKLAGFLCYCRDQDLSEAQMEAGLIKAGNVDSGLGEELEKLAAGLDGPGLLGAGKRQLGNLSRAAKGAKDTVVGSLGTFGTGVPWLLSEGYNQTAGRLGAPEIPNKGLGEFATDYAAVGRGGLKDIVGAGISSNTPGGQGASFLPQAANEWAQSPGQAAKAYDAAWGREGVTEEGRNWGRRLLGTSDALATAAPFAVGAPVSIAGASLAASRAAIPEIIAGEGPYTEYARPDETIQQSQEDTAAAKATPGSIAALPQGHQELYNLALQREQQDIAGEDMLPGYRQRAMDVAPVRAEEALADVDIGQRQERRLMPQDPGPSGDQNPNIPQAGQTPATPGMGAEGAGNSLDQGALSRLPPEQRAEAIRAAEQAQAMGADPQASGQALEELESQDPNTSADQKAQGTLMESLQGNAEAAMATYGQMDLGSKWLLWGGLGLGVIGLLSALTSEKGGLLPWIMALIGGGTALGAAGQGGLLGQGVQGGINELMGSITGSNKPPPVPPEAAQAAMVQIESAVSPEAGFTEMRDSGGGLDRAEIEQALADPAYRQHFLNLPDADRLEIMNEVAEDPVMAQFLSSLQSPGAAKVLTAPKGKPASKFWPLSNYEGHGWSPEEAQRFIELDKLRLQQKPTG